MATHSISVALTADTSNYRREMSKVLALTQKFNDQAEKGGRGGGGSRRATQDVRDLGRAHDEVAPKIRRTGQEATKTSREVASSTRKMRDGLNSVAQMATGFTVGMAAVNVLRAAFNFAGEAVVGFNSKLQVATIGFTTLLGSAGAADVLLEKLRKFAVSTPFEFPDLLEASKRMLALGFESKDIIPNLTAIGDAAAALGSGSEGIHRITIALGQMSAKGKVNANDMKQLTEAGIRGWHILAEAQGVSVGEIMKQSQEGTLTATVAIPQLIAGMNERFGGMMDKMSRTFLGALSNIKDASVQFIARGMQPLFTAMAAGFVQLAEHLQSDEFQLWISRVGEAGAKAMPILLDALKQLGPFIRAMGASVGNLAIALGHLLEDLGPIAMGMVKFMGSIKAAGLHLLARALEEVTEFFSENRRVVQTLAIIYGATLIPAIHRTIISFANLRALQMQQFFTSMVSGVKAMASAFMAASMTSRVAMTGMAAGILAVTAAMIWMDKQKMPGIDKQVAKLEDLSGSFESNVGNYNAMVQEHRRLSEEYNNMDWRERANWGDGGQKRTSELKNAIDDLEVSLKKTGPELEEQRLALRKLGEDAGLSGASLQDFATRSQEFATEYVEAMLMTEQITGITSEKIDEMFKKDSDAVKAFGEAVQQTMQATESSFMAFGDVISGAGSLISAAEQEATSSSKEHTTAVEKLADARKKLSQLEARQAGDTKRSVQDEQALANARDAVREATEGVANAQVKTVNSGALVAQFYRDAITESTNFVANINQATQRGLDPQLIARMLEQGPKEAAPVLEAILADHSGNLIKLANDAEQALGRISAQAVRQARITAIAISPGVTEDVSMQAQLAVAISQAQFAAGGKASAEELANSIKLTPEQVEQISQALRLPPDEKQALVESMKLTPAQVLQIAKSYQITIPQPVMAPPAAPVAGAAPPVSFNWNQPAAGRSLTVRAQGGVYERHDPSVQRGGPIRVWNEPETGGESYIPHAASKRPRAVAVLHKTASILGVRHFANGGIDMPRQSISGGGTVMSQSTRHVYQFNGPIQGVRMEDVERYADRKKRLAALVGADNG